MSIKQQLDADLQQIVDTFELVGLAVGVLREDELIYAQGFGVRNIEVGLPITPHSVFYTASISKTLVAAAVMQLVEADKVKLDEPITTYLPYFGVKDERYKAITVQQMLSHVSGMPDVDDYYWDRPAYDDGALERYVRSLHDQVLLFAPGKAFAYSNMAYEVLGDMIAKVSGQSFEAYIEENILKPLEMKDSTFLRQNIASGLATSPHVRVPNLMLSPIYPYNRAHAPSSTFHSSLVDLSNWAKMHLNCGHFQGKH